VKHKVIEKKTAFGKGFRIYHTVFERGGGGRTPRRYHFQQHRNHIQCFHEPESRIDGAAGVRVAVFIGRFFDTSDDDLDLDFKISESSGEDVSLRNGTNMPGRRGGV